MTCNKNTQINPNRPRDLFPNPGIPIVDPATLKVTPPWQEYFNNIGVTFPPIPETPPPTSSISGSGPTTLTFVEYHYNLTGRSKVKTLPIHPHNSYLFIHHIGPHLAVKLTWPPTAKRHEGWTWGFDVGISSVSQAEVSRVPVYQDIPPCLSFLVDEYIGYSMDATIVVNPGTAVETITSKGEESFIYLAAIRWKDYFTRPGTNWLSSFTTSGSETIENEEGCVNIEKFGLFYYANGQAYLIASAPHNIPSTAVRTVSETADEIKTSELNLYVARQTVVAIPATKHYFKHPDED